MYFLFSAHNFFSQMRQAIIDRHINYVGAFMARPEPLFLRKRYGVLTQSFAHRALVGEHTKRFPVLFLVLVADQLHQIDPTVPVEALHVSLSSSAERESGAGRRPFSDTDSSTAHR